jgi:azurin
LLKISKEDPDGCIDAMKDSNLFWRLTGQRLLVERGQMDVVPELIEMIGDESVDEIGINAPALHALWTLHGLGALDGTNRQTLDAAISALSHPAAGVRKAAIQVLPKTGREMGTVLASEIMNDPDPHTQLAALLSISEFPENAEMGAALYELSRSDRISQDLWLSQALFVAAGKHYSGFEKAYQQDPGAQAYQILPEEEENGPPSVWRAWENPQQVTEQWPEFQAGQAWEESTLPDFNGRVIAYKEFQIKSIPENAFLHLGRIGQSDRGFINGTMLHETRNDPDKMRVYELPVSILRNGMNYVVVTIYDEKGPGGLLGPADEIYLEADEDRIVLADTWKYFVEQRKSRGINYSEFNPGEQLGAWFMTYNAGGTDQHIVDQEIDRDPNAVRIEISAVRNEMTFSENEMVVPAGATVEIEFTNVDLMQHNLLIGAPGSLQSIGTAADELAQKPEGQDQQYVPSIPQVLFATPLINPGETYVLRFRAPEEPGNYVFVCTFPGHWQTMNGVLKVEGPAN